MVTRWAHNPKIGGSIPSLATNKKIFVKVFGNMKIFSDLYISSLTSRDSSSGSSPGS